MVPPGNRGCWWSQRKQGVASSTGVPVPLGDRGVSREGPSPSAPAQSDRTRCRHCLTEQPLCCPSTVKGWGGSAPGGVYPRYRAGHTPLPEGSTGVEAPSTERGPVEPPGPEPTDCCQQASTAPQVRSEAKRSSATPVVRATMGCVRGLGVRVASSSWTRVAVVVRRSVRG